MNQRESLEKTTGIQVAMAVNLARIAHDRDREAFGEIFHHFGPRIKSFMIRKGADQPLAEELVQETMLKVWRKAHLYSTEKGTVTTWLFTIARNLRIDRIRRESTQQFTNLGDYDEPSDDPGSDDLVALTQQQEEVRQALQKLPEEQKMIIHMSFIDDMTQSEISEKLTLPLGTVKSRMRLAYRKLRNNLEGVL